MPSYLVTGANGFIGAALCRMLKKRGDNTVPVVRNARQPGDFAMGALSRTTDWSCALNGVDIVVHLAARVHVMNDSAPDRLAAFRAMNVDVTLNLARQAAQASVKRFIFVSSIGVNGAATVNEPFSELSPPMPHSEYAVSKMEAEEGLAGLCAETGMEYVVIRPPLVYGASAPGNFCSLLKLIRRGLPFPLALVQNRRSLVGLDNLVNFVITCSIAPRAANELFLIADESDVSTPELIMLLSEGMGQSTRIFPFPVAVLASAARMLNKENTFQQLCGSLQIDASKARKLLEWRAPIGTHEGLRRAAARFIQINEEQ